jgi:hypothetical protein
MCFRTNPSLGSTLPAAILAAALLHKAVRLNRCHRVWLGWEADQERIARHLTGSDKPTEADFVQALARWQDQKRSQPGGGDLKVNGILGPDTLRALSAEMSLPLPAGMTSSGSPPRPAWIDWIESPNHLSRLDHPITTIVIHATSGNKMSSAINEFLNGSPSGDKWGGTSAHYVIGRGGEVVQMVALGRAACHAGDPYYRYSKDDWLSKNEYWVPYTEAQYTSLIRLARFLVSCIPTIQRIIGHEHLSCWRRKVFSGGKVRFTKGRSDPGGAFDWSRLKTALAGWFGGTICHQVDKYDKKTGEFRPGNCHLPVAKGLCS